MTCRLMIKTHDVTGLKYLCQTSRDDYITYTGSGLYWKRHLKKHGYNFTTEVIGIYETNAGLKEDGLKYSEQWNIVESKDWANLIPENGTGGDTSSTENYINGMKNRCSFAGENNPQYGKIGELNPKFGKKYGKKHKISEGTKKSWDNNTERKKLHSANIAGDKNPRSKSCIVDGINFTCLKDAAIYFGYDIKCHNYSILRKNHKVVTK